MKKLLLIYFVFNVLLFSAQKNINSSSTASVQNMVTSLKHDTCLNKKFSIVFYVVLDSSYTVGAATPAALNILVANFNNAFKRICVQFLNCSTVFIPQFPYNGWKKNVTESIVTASYYTEKTINIYLVDTVTSGLPWDINYTYPPPLTTPTLGIKKDLIVLKKSDLTNNAECLHQLGHFFGLPHTFDEIGTPSGPPPPGGSYEYFNRTNCYSHGDGFCDTEADCWPIGSVVNNHCNYNYTQGVLDVNNEYYVPPTDNYMSLYTCRCRFTQEQYNYMAYIILTKRLYLH